MRNYKSCALNFLAAGVALSALAAQPAFADVASSNLGASAEVTSNCAVTTSPIAFGDIDVTLGTALVGTGGISVICTSGTPWSASADEGAGTGASLAVRKMADGANLLNYVLYTEPTRTTIWGDGVTTTATIDDTGSGAAQNKIIYGRILASQNGVLAGSYADMVAVTVTY